MARRPRLARKFEAEAGRRRRTYPGSSPLLVSPVRVVREVVCRDRSAEPRRGICGGDRDGQRRGASHGPRVWAGIRERCRGLRPRARSGFSGSGGSDHVSSARRVFSRSSRPSSRRRRCRAPTSYAEEPLLSIRGVVRGVCGRRLEHAYRQYSPWHQIRPARRRDRDAAARQIRRSEPWSVTADEITLQVASARYPDLAPLATGPIAAPQVWSGSM